MRLKSLKPSLQPGDTRLLRAEERRNETRTGTGAGAALPLVHWAVVILGASGATVMDRVPFWLCVLVIASPSALLVLSLWLRDAIAGLGTQGGEATRC